MALHILKGMIFFWPLTVKTANSYPPNILLHVKKKIHTKKKAQRFPNLVFAKGMVFQRSKYRNLKV